MKILLYNDNPVVRKLVALSAQKTKDDLVVIWSVDELEEEAYDLLIVDDALYTDEVMMQLQEKVPFKTTLLMATRGNTIPDGFAKVIHKPFLPTDLVDLFTQIEKSISVPEAPPKEESVKAINLEDEMDEFADTISIDDLPDLGDLDDESEMSVKTNILDHDEVQEVQNLLDDEEIDDEPAFSLDDFEENTDEMGGFAEEIESESDEALLASLDQDLLGDLEEVSSSETLIDDIDEVMEEFELEDDVLEPLRETASESEISEMDEAELAELMGSVDEEIGLEEQEELDMSMDAEEAIAMPDIDEDDFALDEEALLASEDFGLVDETTLEEAPLDDEQMDALEQQIHEAVEELDLGDLGLELDHEELDELGIDKLSGLDMLEGLDGLDSIDEREMKLAVGESVEDEPEVRVGHGEHASLNAEALSEAMEDDMETAVYVKEGMPTTETASASDGLDALQVLLKALSNEEMVKSLKGLNISININFGNEK